MELLSVNFIVLHVLSYPLSLIELVATASGLVSVYLASRGHIGTWPTGILNEVGLFLLFFQVQLYADMFLQIFFFVATVYGWYYWGKPKRQAGLKTITSHQAITVLLLLFGGTISLGFVMSNLHDWAPALFEKEARSPFIDSAVTVASILATVLLARKIVETWLLWIAVDIVSVGLFLSRGIIFLAMEYAVFLLMAGYGYWCWRRQIV